MEEDSIWKRTEYGRGGYMEEEGIWKRTVYGREQYMEDSLWDSMEDRRVYLNKARSLKKGITPTLSSLHLLLH